MLESRSKLSRLGRCDVAVVNAENSKEAFYAFGKVAFRVVNHLTHQPHSLKDQCDHNDVEQLCRQGSPLDHGVASLKGLAVFSLCPTDVCCCVPEVADEAEHLWACPM